MNNLLVSENDKFLIVNGVKLEIRYLQGTKFGSPTLVLLHEGLGCIEMWRDFPEELSKATGYSIFMYSRQGYGLSAPCKLPRPISYMHIEAQEILPEILKVAGITEHILIGHSDGGSIALINAGSDRSDSPIGLKAVVTMAPHVLCEDISISAISKAAEVYSDNNSLKSKLEKYHYKNVDCAFWGWNKVWLDKRFIHWNIEAFVSKISVPQLVIQGENDPYGTMVHLQSIQQHSDGPVTDCTLANCGHAPYKDRAEDTLLAMTHFFKSIE